MDDRVGLATNDLLAERSTVGEDDAILDFHLGEHRVGVSGALVAEIRRQKDTDEQLSRDFVGGDLRRSAVGVNSDVVGVVLRRPKEQICVPLERNLGASDALSESSRADHRVSVGTFPPVGENVGANETVLDDTVDWTIPLTRHDMHGGPHQHLRLCGRTDGLRNMQIHLVSIEIGVE